MLLLLFCCGIELLSRIAKGAPSISNPGEDMDDDASVDVATAGVNAIAVPMNGTIAIRHAILSLLFFFR